VVGRDAHNAEAVAAGLVASISALEAVGRNQALGLAADVVAAPGLQEEWAGRRTARS
jgi:hypothetical protein